MGPLGDILGTGNAVQTEGLKGLHGIGLKTHLCNRAHGPCSDHTGTPFHWPFVRTLVARVPVMEWASAKV